MAGITLDIAQARLTAYLAAEEKLLTGHLSVKINDKEFRRSELSQIQAGVALWNSRVQSLSAAAPGGRPRTLSGVPR